MSEADVWLLSARARLQRIAGLVSEGPLSNAEGPLAGCCRTSDYGWSVNTSAGENLRPVEATVAALGYSDSDLCVAAAQDIGPVARRPHPSTHDSLW